MSELESLCKIGQDPLYLGIAFGSAQLHRTERVEQAVREFGFETATIESPISGAEGNKEFLLYAHH